MSTGENAPIHGNESESRGRALRPGNSNLSFVRGTPMRRSGPTPPASANKSFPSPFSSPALLEPTSLDPSPQSEAEERPQYKKKVQRCIDDVLENYMPLFGQIKSTFEALIQQELDRAEKENAARFSQLRSTHDEQTNALMIRLTNLESELAEERTKGEASATQMAEGLQKPRADHNNLEREKDLRLNAASRFERRLCQTQQELADMGRRNRELNDEKSDLVTRNVILIKENKKFKETDDELQLSQQAERRAHKDNGAFVAVICQQKNRDYTVGVLRDIMSECGFNQNLVEEIVSRESNWVKWVKTAKYENPSNQSNGKEGRKRASSSESAGGENGDEALSGSLKRARR